jgi:zinc transporter
MHFHEWILTESGELIHPNLRDLNNLTLGEVPFNWIHLDLNNPKVKTWLQESSLLCPGVADFILQSIHSANHERVAKIDNCLVMSMKDFHVENSVLTDESTLGNLLIVISEKFLLTISTKSLVSIDGLHKSIARHKSAAHLSPVALFHEILELRSEKLRSIMINLSNLIFEMEEKMLNGIQPINREHLGNIRTQCLRLMRQYIPELAPISHINHFYPAWFTDQDKSKLTECLDRLVHQIRDLRTLYDRGRMVQDEYTVRIQEMNAKNLHVLSVVSVIVLPTALISSLFGMNLPDIPQLPFPYVVLSCIVSSGVVYLCLKLKKYF